MNGYDRIPIVDKSELAQYGFDPNLFIRKGRDKIGGYEWHGPCPQCPGSRDRLIISNGMYWCRKCGYKGALAARAGVKLTDDRREAIARRMKEEQAQELARRRVAIERLTKERLWEKYHKNLLSKPDEITQLNKDGIPMRAIKHFQIGYNPQFSFILNDKLTIAPALTFPILRNGWCLNIRHRILLPPDVIQGDKYRPIFTHLGLSYLVADFPDSDWIVIVEGEKKAIVLWSNGIPAIAIWGVYSWYEEWIPKWKKQYNRFYIIFDDDNEGVRQAAKKLAKAVNGKIVSLGGKPDDLLVSGQLTPIQLLEQLLKDS